MIAAIDALVLLIVMTIGVLIYRSLIHSQWFAGLVGSVTHPSPETTEEVLKDLTRAENNAWDRAEDAKITAAKARDTTTEIKRHVRRKPTPF